MDIDLEPRKREVVSRLLARLIDQGTARVLVRPYGGGSGEWFGGGNVLADEAGVLWLGGRYRTPGDSRTGTDAGQRGLEFAIFRSDDHGQSFTKVLNWSKQDLSRQGESIVSIEGAALHRLANGTVELFISTENLRRYPEPLASYQKPGTGVWTIGRMVGESVERLDSATLGSVLECPDRPAYLHVKDPIVFDDQALGTVMLFCSHPFAWSSANTGLAVRAPGADQFEVRSWQVVERGVVWDVASTRITSRLCVPSLGLFADEPPCSIYFYDGCECFREHEQHATAHSRPRGYSCEELGGAMVGWDKNFPQMHRLSELQPMFVSPHGSGCSRYVDVLRTPRGLFATWQQSQPDGSQPLVGHCLTMDEVESILQGA